MKVEAELKTKDQETRSIFKEVDTYAKNWIQYRFRQRNFKRTWRK